MAWEQGGGVYRMLIGGVLTAALSGGSVLLGDSVATTGSVTRPIEGVSAGLPARAEPHDADTPRRGQFGWPLAGSPRVVRGFQPPALPYGPGHRGIDLAADADAPVLAAGAGTVMFAGMVAGRGVVSVRHPGGLRTTYEPVSATVVTGAQVARGERIGTLAPGHPGCPATVCLHWGAFRDPALPRTDPVREYLNPLWLIFGVRVRLLPIDSPPDLP